MTQIKKRHPAVKHLRDASLAWVLEIEAEVDEKVRTSEAHASRPAASCAVCLSTGDSTTALSTFVLCVRRKGPAAFQLREMR